MEIKGDQVIFLTGRILYANGGVIGLNSLADYASEGWDGRLEPEPYDDDDDRFSKAERTELADYMIALWIKYKENKNI